MEFITDAVPSCDNKVSEFLQCVLYIAALLGLLWTCVQFLKIPHERSRNSTNNHDTPFAKIEL